MLELKNRKQLADDAHMLAKSTNLIRYRNITYIPLDFETLKYDPPPDKDRTVWSPLTRDKLRRIAAHQFQALFGSDSDLASFDFMVAQNAEHVDEDVDSLLIKTDKGLKLLTSEGKLVKPTGSFVPNTIYPQLVTDKAAKERVFKVIEEWVDGEDEAHSLLHHLATVLSPGWSAVKYVILLGEGRNGKSVLLKMLLALLGRENVSSVTRQHIAEHNPVVTDLNGKLLNIVFDGQSTYLKDSGPEKSLVAGESVPIRRLYESTPVLVQTNALFIEGLNKEPKSNDKSSALQKRLVRFGFPNVYALDLKFEAEMLSDESLGAFLALLIDHYVKRDELADKLKLTAKAIELQLDHMYHNSIALQFLKYEQENSLFGPGGVVGEKIDDLIREFHTWRLKENDLSTWSEPDIVTLFLPLLDFERKSMRVGGQPRKVRVVVKYKQEAQAFLDSLEGADDDIDVSALVAD